MSKILLVSKTRANFEKLTRELNEYQENQISWVATSKEAMPIAINKEVDVIISDAELGDSDGLSFIKLIAQKCPLINSALVSSVTDDEFHEITEGLGVFMQLPDNPGNTDAEKIMQILQSINVLLAK